LKTHYQINAVIINKINLFKKKDKIISANISKTKTIFCSRYGVLFILYLCNVFIIKNVGKIKGLKNVKKRDKNKKT